ncbi:MAG: MarR family transcriptional regulator [Nitrospinae bacterium]|nr:MarR family transcriptional regulator [Nitrospinota bacterium]
MGTHYRGPRNERRALDAFIKLARAGDAVMAATAAAFEDEGLTISQFGALETLYHLGPMSQKQIAAKILRSGGNLTLVVDNLERRGLAVRRPGADRRVNTVTLTPKGRRLMERLFPRVAGRIAEVMETLGGAELETLGALLKKLGRSAAARGARSGGRHEVE